MPPLLLLLWLAISATAAVDSSGAGDNQCLSLCTACESFRPARINKICSLGLLTGCGCPEYAMNLTTVEAAAVRGLNRNCPATARIGFCPYGQRTDAAGCPQAICQSAPGCPSTDARDFSNPQQPAVKDCRAHCPSGFQTDASGCPVCRCRCGGELGDLPGGGDGGRQLERSCVATCASVGATHELLPPATEGACPTCLCRGAAAADLQTPVPAPAPPQASQAAQPACLLRCPNSCGLYGYADGESRDARGCVRDCSCRCPPRQDCSTGEHCLRWEIDRFGCQVCSNCRSSSSSRQDCVTKATLLGINEAAANRQQLALLSSLCPLNCPPGAGYLLLSPDSGDSCLTCRCQTVDPATAAAAPPRTACPRRSCNCFYGSRRDANGCDTCECVSANEYLQFLPF